MIEFQNVSKSYAGIPAITQLNLTIARGELLVLLGPSGSGKSTVLKMINRMVSVEAGQVSFEGQDVGSLNVRDLRLRMGYAIQSVGLFPHWTVEQNIGTVPQLLGWTRDRTACRVTELLTLFGMAPKTFRGRYPHQLSGGQQQRVGVARALAGDPAVLLMDEPFGALDPVRRTALQLELKRLHQTSGKTIVLVTHDLDEAVLLGTRIVLLDHGRVMQAGPPAELLSHPVNDFVADFMGRADAGIKLLSLHPIAPRVSATVDQSLGFSIALSANVREAISMMALHGVSALCVVDAAGVPVGCVRASRLLTSAGHG